MDVPIFKIKNRHLGVHPLKKCGTGVAGVRGCTKLKRRI